MSRNTPLPVSAQECAASARSDADPVTTAATDFATATSKLAAKATRTVVRLADPAPRAALESCPRNGSDFRGASRLDTAHEYYDASSTCNPPGRSARVPDARSDR